MRNGLLPKIVQHCESFIMKYSLALYHFIFVTSIQHCSVCVCVCVCVLCDARLFGFSHLVISKYENQFYVLVCLCTSAKRTTSLDSGTINETHEYILKDISIKSRSKSQLYCTRSDADKMCARCWVLSSCNHSPNPQQRTPTFRCKSTSSTSIPI